jgi:hypothetical protein
MNHSGGAFWPKYRPNRFEAEYENGEQNAWRLQQMK